MSVIEKTVKIASIQRLDEKVHLTLIIVEPSLMQPKVPRPEVVIEKLPKSDSEKVAREMAKGLTNELRRQGMIPTQPTVSQIHVPSSGRFTLVLTREEYEKLGNPTVFDEFRLKLERKGRKN